MKSKLFRRIIPLALVVVLLVLTQLMLKRFSKALLGQPTMATTRGGNEDKILKKRESNAHQVKKLQQSFNDMLENRRKEKMEEREAMRGRRERISVEDFGETGDGHDRLIKDQMERYRARSSAERSRRKSGRSSANSQGKDGDDDGFTDERATYYMSQIRRKASLVANHLERTAHKFSEDEQHDINQQIVDYINMEKKVAAYVQRTADEFNKARDIDDKDKRMQYLERVKAARLARQPEEKTAREAARDHFLQIRGRLEPHLYGQEL